jgi:hypothetical protein
MLNGSENHVLLDFCFDSIVIDLIGHLSLILIYYEMHLDEEISIQHVNQLVLEFWNDEDFCYYVLVNVSNFLSVFDNSNDCDFLSGFEI